MALKNYNPVTPGQRQLVLVDRSGLHTGAPVKALTEGKSSSGGRNNSGSITSRYRGGGHKQAYRHDRLQAPQVRRAGQGRAARIRSEPHRLHRADQIRGRRARLYPGAAAACGRRHRRRRRVCRREARQRHADRQHSGRHHRAQYRAQDRQGRPDRALGRHLCPDRRPRRRLRDPAAQFRRAAAGARPLHRHRRRGVEPGQHERLDRQGRAQRAGWAGAAMSAARR